MCITFDKPSQDVIETIESAFRFSNEIFHPNNIQFSILEKFQTCDEFSLSYSECNFFYLLLEQYRKDLIRRKKDIPARLDGYRFVCKYLSIVEDLLAFLEDE